MTTPPYDNSWERRHLMTPENDTRSVYCAEEDFITSLRIACQNRPVRSNKGKLALYSDPNLGAGKTLQCPQANKCSSLCLSQTFRSPLNVSNIIPSHPPLPAHRSLIHAGGMADAVASNLRMPRCRRCILPLKRQSSREKHWSRSMV